MCCWSLRNQYTCGCSFLAGFVVNVLFIDVPPLDSVAKKVGVSFSGGNPGRFLCYLNNSGNFGQFISAQKFET